MHWCVVLKWNSDIGVVLCIPVQLTGFSWNQNESEVGDAAGWGWWGEDGAVGWTGWWRLISGSVLPPHGQQRYNNMTRQTCHWHLCYLWLEMRAGNERGRAHSEELSHHFRRLGGTAVVVIGQKRTCHTVPTGVWIKSLAYVWFMLKQQKTTTTTKKTTISLWWELQFNKYLDKNSNFLLQCLQQHGQLLACKKTEKRKHKKDIFTGHWHDYMLELVPPTVLDISYSLICCGLSRVEGRCSRALLFAAPVCVQRNNTIWVIIHILKLPSRHVFGVYIL